MFLYFGRLNVGACCQRQLQNRNTEVVLVQKEEDVKAFKRKTISFSVVFILCHMGTTVRAKVLFQNMPTLSLYGRGFQNRSDHVAINISNMLNRKTCSYGRHAQIAIAFSNEMIYMKDSFPHQIGQMALSITCSAIYLTNIDEFIMVTVLVGIMKCHQKIGWLK